VEVAETKPIEVVVNGVTKTVPRPPRVFHVKHLLEFLEMDPARVAVELNRAIVRKQDWESTVVQDGAVVEVVWFVGGG
jgi:sulfur carrier protein